jgi:hypothetical protein
VRLSHLILAVTLLACIGDTAYAADACAKLIPHDAKLAVVRDFPGFRLPSEKDNEAYDIAERRKAGGTACLGAAIGRFTGPRDGVALLLTRKDRDDTILIVATPAHRKWRTWKLRDWGANRRRIFVETAARGEFMRTDELEGAVSERGKKLRMHASHDAIMSGMLESSAAVYAHDGKQWHHVWISD